MFIRIACMGSMYWVLIRTFPQHRFLWRNDKRPFTIYALDYAILTCLSECTGRAIALPPDIGEALAFVLAKC